MCAVPYPLPLSRILSLTLPRRPPLDRYHAAGLTPPSQHAASTSAAVGATGDVSASASGAPLRVRSGMAYISTSRDLCEQSRMQMLAGSGGGHELSEREKARWASWYCEGDWHVDGDGTDGMRVHKYWLMLQKQGEAPLHKLLTDDDQVDPRHHSNIVVAGLDSLRSVYKYAERDHPEATRSATQRHTRAIALRTALKGGPKGDAKSGAKGGAPSPAPYSGMSGHRRERAHAMLRRLGCTLELDAGDAVRMPPPSRTLAVPSPTFITHRTLALVAHTFDRLNSRFDRPRAGRCSSSRTCRTARRTCAPTGWRCCSTSRDHLLGRSRLGPARGGDGDGVGEGLHTMRGGTRWRGESTRG